ncbi:hypothetical protein ACA910_007640 [Epithemia clementina (nom. ined.)]
MKSSSTSSSSKYAVDERMPLLSSSSASPSASKTTKPTTTTTTTKPPASSSFTTPFSLLNTTDYNDNFPIASSSLSAFPKFLPQTSSNLSSNNNNNNNNKSAATAAAELAQAMGEAVETAFDAGDSDQQSPPENHQTTVPQTFVHLIKGYIGPGMLSLPWAVSQLGLSVGCLGIVVMAFWSSYNCWTVVRLKRFIVRQQAGREITTSSGNALVIANNSNNNTTTGNTNAAGGGDTGDLISETASSVATTNITYPDVGEWAYGKTFQSYVSGCICTQQLAICTVFFSFVGENVLAVLDQMDQQYGIRLSWHFLATHMGVMTMALPFFMSLSFIPSIKGLSTVMMIATVLLIVSLALLGLVVDQEWYERPTRATDPDDTAYFQAPKAPLSLCAILYSFEGICLVLPIESAMKEPKYFKPVFITSMAAVALILAVFSSICVLAFGKVTNGSITAFLILKYQDNESLQGLLLLTNLAVSLSVLFTYPLQMYPAVELMGPSWSQVGRKLWKRCCCCCGDAFGGGGGDVEEDENEEGEKDLTGFDPLPPLPEHGAVVVSQWDWDDLEEHRYEDEEENKDDNKDGENKDKNGNGPLGTSFTLDTIKKDGTKDAANDDAVSLRSFLSSAISFPNQMMPKMILPGDSPQLRAALVLLTFVVAVVVPNVQALISLAGALAGSSSALLIPPVLKLAYLRHLEEGTTNPSSTSRPEGAFVPSSPVIPPRFVSNQASAATKRSFFTFSKWWMEKLECYILFAAGVVFLIIGTNASLADIAAIYMGKDRRL